MSRLLQLQASRIFPNVFQCLAIKSSGASLNVSYCCTKIHAHGVENLKKLCHSMIFCIFGKFLTQI